MRWPWTRVPKPPAPNLQQACRELEAVIAQREDVDALAHHLGRHREMNHFADLVFRGRVR